MLAAAVVPLLIVTSWYGNDLVQVGELSGSTWFGVDLSRMTNSILTVPERRALSDDGTTSAISMVPPFSEPGSAVPRSRSRKRPDSLSWTKR